VTALETWGTILGMAAVTFLARWPGVALLARPLPGRLETFLRHVPPAVFAALVVPAVLAPDGQIGLDLRSAAPVTAGGLIGLATRQLGLAIAGGLGAYWVGKLSGLW
jgi:branched-subunit amino acid transport protein